MPRLRFCIELARSLATFLLSTSAEEMERDGDGVRSFDVGVVVTIVGVAFGFVTDINVTVIPVFFKLFILSNCTGVVVVVGVVDICDVAGISNVADDDVADAGADDDDDDDDNWHWLPLLLLLLLLFIVLLMFTLWLGLFVLLALA